MVFQRIIQICLYLGLWKTKAKLLETKLFWFELSIQLSQKGTETKNDQKIRDRWKMCLSKEKYSWHGSLETNVIEQHRNTPLLGCDSRHFRQKSNAQDSKREMSKNCNFYNPLNSSKNLGICQFIACVLRVSSIESYM